MRHYYAHNHGTADVNNASALITTHLSEEL